MTVASLAQIKAKFSAYLLEAEASGPVVVTRKGRAVAVIVAPADDADLEALLLSRSPRFRSLLSKSRRSIASGRGETHEEFWRDSARGSSRPRLTDSTKRKSTA
jgi:prevent-host-death family protein